MTQEQIDRYKNAARRGTLPDELNPLFILSTIHTELLIEILSGKVDCAHLAAMELNNRGLNCKGEWVGFKAWYNEAEQTVHD